MMESNKIVIIKKHRFCWKCYISDGLFKLNNFYHIYHDSSIVLNVEFSCLWHERLSHVSHRKINKLTDINLQN